jgi:hypothetical protein
MDHSRREQVIALAMQELRGAFERLAAQLRAKSIVQNDGDASKAVGIWLACAEVMTVRMREVLTQPTPPKAAALDQRFRDMVVRIAELERLYRAGEM